MRAQALDEVIGDSSVASYGIGTAVTELWLARLRPARPLIGTELAPETVKRLTDLLPEMDIRPHDLRSDDPLEADVHVFFRVDTELDDREFRDVLRRFRGERVLVAATETLTLRAAVRELRTRLKPRVTRAGFVRNSNAFESLWMPTHDAARLPVADLHGWLLEPRGTGRK